MPSDEERTAALNQMLARNGQGMPGENRGYYDQIVRPVLSAPQGERAAMSDRVYADRNRIVRDAARHMVGGYGSALNAARTQTESEWMRRYLESLQPKDRSGSGSGGGGGSEVATDTPPVPPTTAPGNDWSWVNDYVTANTPRSAPSIGGGGRQPHQSRAGSVAASGLGRAQPRTQPRPRALPRQGNY